MKTFRLKYLIDNKDNPKIVKKILDSTELSKLDKKDLLKDLKTLNTNKEELTLDSDTIQQKCYFVRMDKYSEFLENGMPGGESFENDMGAYIQFLVSTSNNFCKPTPPYNNIIGFRYNIAKPTIYDVDDYDIPDEILEYFIEVPFTRFYDKDTNFFCYGGNEIENGKELYKRFSKLNLTEREWFTPNGYIFMVPNVKNDDVQGIITKVKKVGDVFEYESYLNDDTICIDKLLSSGEVISIE